MGGSNKKARVKWEIMIKTPAEGGTGITDPIMTIDATKINMLKKLVSRERQPWMRWIERKLIKVANKWEVEEAMAAKPSKKQRK